jgi:hypothetical protein
MTRVGHALLTLLGGACLVVGCGTTPRDININTDAESGFEPPPFVPEASADTLDAGGEVNDQNAGTGGMAGDTSGTAGSTGGTGGAGGTAGTTAPSDASTDGGAG